VTDGGAEGIRTPDPHNAIVVLYQLSYDPDQRTRSLFTGGFVSKRNCHWNTLSVPDAFDRLQIRSGNEPLRARSANQYALAFGALRWVF
jgi:hypothetical protein